MNADAERSVLLVGNFLSGSARNRSVCEDLADGLAGVGWSVLTTSRFASRGRRLGDMVATAWRRRREYRVAQVDVYSGPAFFWAEAVCWTLRRAGKPYVLTLHGGNLPDFARGRPGRVRKLLRSAGAVTSPSGYLIHHMKPFRDDVRLLPNFLDLASYEDRPRPRPQPRLVWLRAFHEIYRPTLAVEVLARLREEYPDVRLTMIGPDKGDGSLGRVRRLAAELGVEDRLSLPGGVPKGDVPARLAGYDVFMNTATVDNTPVSVVEAMACGLCVVSTDVGGIPYLLEHGRDALLVPPDDPAAMAAAVRRVLDETGLAEGLSRGARAKAKTCDRSLVLPQWDGLLSDLALARRPGKAGAEPVVSGSEGGGRR